jgi:hypothetical protein
MDWRTDPDYCARCMIEYPVDRIVLPDLLTRALIWAIDHSVLVDRFFVWTCEQSWHVHLPKWWSY